MLDLIETIDAPVYRLVERTKPAQEGGKTFLRFEAVLGQADIKNQNGRVYPLATVKREVESFNERIARGRGFSETDHPEKASLAKTSIIWQPLKVEADGTIVGSGVIPETAAGKDLAAIFEAGGRPGFSTRGTGETKRGKYEGIHGVIEDADIVQPTFRLKAIDAVGDPSVDHADTKRVFREHKDQSMDIKSFDELKQKHPEIAELVLKEAETRLKAEFEAALEAKRGEIRAEVVEELQKGGVAVDEDTVAAQSAVISFAEAVMDLARAAGLAEPPQVIGDDAVAEHVAALEARIAELEQDNTTLATRIAEDEAGVEKAQVEKKAKEKAKTACGANESCFESLVATSMDLFETVDDLEAGFDTLAERFTKVAATTAKLPKGAQGKTVVNTAKETAPIAQKDKKLNEQAGEGDEESSALADLALGRRG